MKRYISAILIPCLLLELFGCMGSYVFHDMTLEELKNYAGDENVMLKTENEGYALYRKKHTCIN
jgi:hypothetical protein